MFGELSRKYSEHINNLVESIERVSYALFVHEPGHAGHLYIYPVRYARKAATVPKN